MHTDANNQIGKSAPYQTIRGLNLKNFFFPFLGSFNLHADRGGRLRDYYIICVNGSDSIRINRVCGLRKYVIFILFVSCVVCVCVCARARARARALLLSRSTSLETIYLYNLYVFI